MKKNGTHKSKPVALVPVILCGGSGTRLWPLSRAEHPKQFLDMAGHSLFRDTILRAMAIPDACAPCVVCNETQRFLAAAELQALSGKASILLEHEGRNTAPAIALAALHALADADMADKDVLLLVLPSDHMIRPLQTFVDAVMEGVQCATEGQGRLVTFGIKPTRPETGFGYIRPGDKLSCGYTVASFEEKPTKERALELLAQGYYWNSGMFLFRASLFLEELAHLAPGIHGAATALWLSRAKDLDFTRFNAALCKACPADSIDKAVMERTQKAAVIPLDADWSDLGSWEAFHSAATKDSRGNAIVGDVLLEDTDGSYVYSSGRLVATLGVRDLVVVETPDAVLVTDKKRSQDVKEVLARLKKAGRKEAEAHLKVYRPWGSYETLALGERFQVKRIEVLPGASLSLQRHHHRAEHWVVVSGTAKITRGEENLLLTEDQSTYIPLGTVHRLENPGRIPLMIMEIQTGAYLGEDDIVRLQDTYGREKE